MSLIPKNVVPWHWHSPSGLARPGPQWSRQPSFRPPVVVGHLFAELLRRNQQKKVVVVTVDAIECRRFCCCCCCCDALLDFLLLTSLLLLLLLLLQLLMVLFLFLQQQQLLFLSRCAWYSTQHCLAVSAVELPVSLDFDDLSRIAIGSSPAGALSRFPKFLK